LNDRHAHIALLQDQSPKLYAFQRTISSTHVDIDHDGLNLSLDTGIQWLFSMGLALSSGVDILITVFLFFLLQRSRNNSLNLDHIIDSLILYTFEIGSLTSAATVVSMICWLRLDNSLIFLGLHFVIGKLYANSLLATLNAREQLRRARSSSLGLVNINPPQELPSVHFANTESSCVVDIHSIQVNVTKSVQYDK